MRAAGTSTTRTVAATIISSVKTVMASTTKRKVCVLGGGNSAHVVSGLFADAADWDCNVFVPYGNEAEQWNADGLSMELQYGLKDDQHKVQSKPNVVSKNASDVIPGCEILILCVPALGYDSILEAIAPHVDQGAAIGTICSSNAVNWCIDSHMMATGRSRDSYTIFALQNLPWACRISHYGHAVEVLGVKPFMEFVARPPAAAPALAKAIGDNIKVELKVVEHCGFIGMGMSNVCQVIHPAVMYGNFATWDGKTPFPTKPLFYQGLSDETADMMDGVSNEIIAICKDLEHRTDGLDLSVVKHISEWAMRAYGKYITDDSTLRTKFSSNTAYAGLTCPMKPEGDGFVPDFNARYLTEDIPYNLVAVKGVALMAEVPTPIIDKLIIWSQGVIGKEYLVDGKLTGKDISHSFAPQRYGFHSLHDISSHLRDTKDHTPKPPASPRA